MALLSFAAPGSMPPAANAGAARGGASVGSAAAETLATLQRGVGNQIRSHVSAATGQYGFVRAPRGAVLARPSGGTSPARALSFLSQHGALVGLNNAERAALSSGSTPGAGSELRLLRAESDAVGSAHVRFDQFYQGLRVFGAQLVVHMEENGITGVSGDFVPQVSVSTTPAIAKEAAAQQAITLARKAGAKGDLNATKTELAVYPLGLLQGAPVQNRLAYGVELSGTETHEQVWIDAESGALLNRIALRHSALYREVWSPQYEPLPPPAPVQPFLQRKEGDPPHPTPFVNNLYDFAGDTYNFYRSGFGRDSWDGAGAKMISVYLINQQCPNAYWNGESTNYCPVFDADDVVSHEWGHAYTERTHGLIYSYQSGALNESYSDIYGEVVDLLNARDALGGSNNAQPFPTGQRWLVGEDLGEEAQTLLLRDMYDPDRLGDPGKVSSENYHCDVSDGGGVHTNSGVPNHAFALIVDGTQFKAGNVYNGQTIAGIGMTKAAAIYYRAMTFYQTPTTNFPVHDLSIQTSCSDLIGKPINALSTANAATVPSAEVITAADCAQVAKAMLAVEMSGPPPCPFAPILAPGAAPLCAGSSSGQIYSEDWESGDDGWTRTSDGLFPEWEDASRKVRDFKLVTTLPGGRTGTAAYARAPRVGQEGGGNCEPGSGDYSGSFTIDTPAIRIATGQSDVHLAFDHYVATEGTVDGGQVEISRDGGANYTLVPRSAYVYNPPNGAYDAPPPLGVNTNGRFGQEAWTGTNGGSLSGSWGTTLLDLSSLASPGDTIKLRFTWTQDGCNGLDGWYIDNIRVFNCPLLQAPTLATGSDYQNNDPDGIYTLSWQRPAGAAGPDVLQESQTSCAPLFFDNADGPLATNWTMTRETFAPTWRDEMTKPQHAPNQAYWASPTGGEVTFGTSTLTMKNAVTVPLAGTTTLSFREWYFNEEEDRAYAEVSSDNGSTWNTLYTNARGMGGLPSEGANAFANEPLTPKQFDLTPYKGKQIKVRFRIVLGDSDFFLFVTYGWYIDDILITNDSWTDVATTSTTSAQVARPTGSYCYRVRSTYAFGNEVAPGPFSNLVNVTVAPGVNPPPPPSRGTFRFSQPTYDAGENAGTATIKVVRANGSAETVTVNYATSDGSASAGADYAATSGTLTFAAGDREEEFTIDLTDDTADEDDETVNLTLSNATNGASLGTPGTAVLTIIDNEGPSPGAPGTLRFSAAEYSTAEDAGTATISVGRTGGTTGEVSVSYATSDGSASAGSDYTAASGTLTFADGETTKTFSVQLLDDPATEPEENLLLSLSAPTGGAALGSPSSATLTIVDTDRGAPPAQLVNISTRLPVKGGDKVGIGGFIISGNAPKRVLLRGVGPSLASGGEPVAGRLQDPVIELYDGNGVFMAANDNWKDSPERAEIEASGLAPSQDAESAIARTVTPGAYTVMVFGKDNSEGIGLVEAYDRDEGGQSDMANISTRGFVDTGDNVLIGGFIAGARSGATNVIVRAIGPSLSASGVPDALQDPMIELVDANGQTLDTSDNWKDSADQSEVSARSLAPKDDRESAALHTLTPGNYTAIVRGKDGSTGVALVEVYNVP